MKIGPTKNATTDVIAGDRVACIVILVCLALVLLAS